MSAVKLQIKDERLYKESLWRLIDEAQKKSKN